MLSAIQIKLKVKCKPMPFLKNIRFDEFYYNLTPIHDNVLVDGIKKNNATFMLLIPIKSGLGGEMKEHNTPQSQTSYSSFPIILNPFRNLRHMIPANLSQPNIGDAGSDDGFSYCTVERSRQFLTPPQSPRKSARSLLLSDTDASAGRKLLR